MAELVAWSNIQVGEANEDAAKLSGGEVKVIKPGESVSQGDLGLDDAQFDQLVKSGAVRTLPYPDMPEEYQNSPVEFLREQTAKIAEDALAGVETSEENMEAAAAMMRAATGTPEPEPLPDDIQAEMDKQLEDTGADSGGSASGGTASSGTSSSPPAAGGSGS
jgi:hypothetical protein